MISTAQDLSAALHSRGLLANGPFLADAIPSTEHERPWFVSLLLGVSGWIAGLFLLVFVGLLFQPTKAPAALTTGLVLIAAAWGLFRLDRSAAFVSQFALALSIAGQSIFLYGVFDALNGEHHLALMVFCALLLQAVMALIMPSHLHRLLSALFACIAWAFSVRFGLFGEPSFGRGADLSPPLGLTLTSWALAWSPVAVTIYALVRTEAAWMARGWQPVVRPILTGLIAGLAYATLASHPFETFRWWGSAPVQQNWLALWPMLSAIASLAALIAAFAMGSRALIGACIAAMLVHMSHFYYELGTSLLIKSLIMLAMGGAMLLAAQILSKEHNK
jgi:Domain of unknown function (DUF4401)